MNIKEKVDIIAKQADIIYKKIFIFSAIAGGSWIYGIKTNKYRGQVIMITLSLAPTLHVVALFPKQTYAKITHVT